MENHNPKDKAVEVINTQLNELLVIERSEKALTVLFEQLDRWMDRTVVHLAKYVNQDEADKLASKQLGSFSTRNPRKNLLDTINMYRGFLTALVDEMHNHPAQFLAQFSPSLETHEDIHELWGPVRGALQELSIPEIRKYAGIAGFDVAQIPSRSEAAGGSGSRAEVMPALDRLFNNMDESQKRRAVQILAEDITEQGGDIANDLGRYLERLGYGFVEGQLVRTSVLSPEDMEYLPEVSREDLAGAAKRLRDGDIDGALSSVCGAIDNATAAIYREKNLGPPGDASFQQKVVRSLDAKGTYQRLVSELCGLGWDEADAEKVSKNLKGAINQAAFVLQALRPKMSDVHGGKPTIRWVVFDALKWSQAILALLAQPEEP